MKSGATHPVYHPPIVLTILLELEMPIIISYHGSLLHPPSPYLKNNRRYKLFDTTKMACLSKLSKCIFTKGVIKKKILNEFGLLVLVYIVLVMGMSDCKTWVQHDWGWCPSPWTFQLWPPQTHAVCPWFCITAFIHLFLCNPHYHPSFRWTNCQLNRVVCKTGSIFSPWMIVGCICLTFKSVIVLQMTWIVFNSRAVLHIVNFLLTCH